MGAIGIQITSFTIVYSIVYSDADQRKHQSSASLAFVWGIHRGPVNSPHKWPVMRKMFPFDDVIMSLWKVTWVSCVPYLYKLESLNWSSLSFCYWQMYKESQLPHMNCKYHASINKTLPWLYYRPKSWTNCSKSFDVMFHNTIFFQAQKRALNQHTDPLACLHIICIDELY